MVDTFVRKQRITPGKTDELRELVDELRVEARANSTHRLHELEDAVMETVLEDPEEVGSFESLFHGVSPNRPTEFVVQ
ncbi:hypothetical protein [Haloferax sp. YSSS75]|uniref:hypothetical protein n=1 Tax=Haloferax sp. YSSS75 TaxID=3388564 RepID=UPI00398D229E